MWASGAAPAVRDATCSGLEIGFTSQWWVFTGEVPMHSSQHYLGDKQHILMPLFSSGAGELLTRVLVTSKAELPELAVGGAQEMTASCDTALWAAEGCTPRFQLYVMDTALSFPGVKTTMSHKCVSQSGSQRDLAVLAWEPLGFPEAVHSPPSAESELLLSCDSGHTVLSVFWARILLVHHSGQLCFLAAEWAHSWMLWLEEMKLLVMSFVFTAIEDW